MWLSCFAVYAADPSPIDDTSATDMSSQSSMTSSHESSYVAGMGTFTKADKKRGINGTDVRRAVGGQFLYGHQWDSRFGYEIGGFFDTFETGVSGGTDFYRQGVGADVFYAFGDRRRWTPFVLIGAGGDRNDVFPDGKDGFSWYANAGVGIVTSTISRALPIKFRAEARYVYDGWDNKNKDIRFGLGIEIPLTDETRYEARPQKAEVRVVEVEKVVEKIVEVQTGLKDSDGDGIVDGSDKCPDTPPNTRVDGDGCSLGKVIELKGLHFEFNQTRLRPDAETILNWAAAILKKYPDMNVEVAGHTDSVGSDSYNLNLSQGRAQAVKDYLVQHGVPETQMTAKGYGESQPIDSNDTDEGRERNRRVELRVLN